MDEKGFKLFLEPRKLSDERIEKFLHVVKKYDELFKLSPKKEYILAFSETLIRDGQNEVDSYYALMLYGKFAGIDNLYVTALELIDGTEAMGNLYEKLAGEEGEQLRDEIFKDVEVPPLGTPLFKLPVVTQKVMDRMEARLGPERTKEMLADCLRDLDDNWFIGGREKYKKAGSLDEFLKVKGDDFITELTRIKDEGGHFFTQPISQDVIEYVEANPQIRQGVRKGNTIFHTKIPFMAIEYLAESDENLKRYYYCHCPWARESLVQESVDVPASFCNCSAGFHKREWEVILEQTLRAEVVESVLDGDLQCTIAIHLPDNL